MKIGKKTLSADCTHEKVTVQAIRCAHAVPSFLVKRLPN